MTLKICPVKRSAGSPHGQIEDADESRQPHEKSRSGLSRGRDMKAGNLNFKGTGQARIDDLERTRSCGQPGGSWTTWVA